MMRFHKVILLSIAVVFLLSPAVIMATDAPPKAGAVKEMTKDAAGKMDKVNLNTASIQDLSKIPGVGPELGEAIGAYREANGAFNSITDLAKVKGMDPGLVEKIAPFLSL